MRYTDNLQSPRLTTRFLTPDDAKAWEEYCADPVATEFTLVPDMTPAQMAVHFVGYALNRYDSGRLGLQAIINKETGEFMGQCGLLIQEVNGQPVVEIGYHFIPRYWGKGFASEAARLFRDYGFTNGFADSLVSLIHPQNENSKRVARANGMTLIDEQADFRGKPVNLFRITRAEWEQLTNRQ